jgi:hypothetical protein
VGSNIQLDQSVDCKCKLCLAALEHRRADAFYIIPVLDIMVAYLSSDLLGWFFHHRIILFYISVGGSWLNMAELIQSIIVRFIPVGQHPQNVQQVINCLEQTVRDWKRNSTPFVRKGKSR